MKHSLRDSIWRHRDLRLLLPARALSTFGDDVAILVLVLRLYDEGLGPWSITGLLVCAALPVVVLAPAAGRLVDAVPFRRLAVAAATWQAVCCVALALVEPVWSIYLLVLALQAGHVVAGPAWQAILPNIAERDEVGRAVGASQALSTVAAVAAPAAAGLLVALTGYGAPLLLDAATFVVLGAAGLAIHATRGGREAARSETGPPGSSSLRADALLWPLLAGLCVLVLAGEVTNVVEVFLLRGDLGAGPVGFGLVGAVLAAGIVGGSLLAGRAASHETRARRTTVAALVLTVALTAAGVAPALWLFAVAWAVVGVANGMVNADVSTLLLERTPDAARGRMLARVNAMLRGSALGAMALGGAAGAVLGPRATFVAAGVASTSVAAALLVRIRRVLRRDASQRPSPPTGEMRPVSEPTRLRSAAASDRCGARRCA